MAKTEKRPRRPRAENPRGFRDLFGAPVAARLDTVRAITEVYHRYGFEPLETPAIEYVEALGKFLPDVDRPEGGVFGFQDEDERWLALRYDMTAPLARVAAQHRLSLPTPYRRYTAGPVWRNEKPGPGRYREFWQCDADTVGSADVASDAEICAMLADALETIGIAREDYLIRINNRKVLNGVMEAAGLAGDDNEARRGIVLRAVDKLDRLGEAGVRALLGAGRKDESGDFTDGAGLGEEQAGLIMGFVSAGRETGAATCARLRELIGTAPVGAEGVTELERMAELLEAQGYGADRVVIDPSVVRGLAYYTGPVYEAELTTEVLDEKGRPRRFGSVAGGGRYDDLVKRFTGQAVPATGISIGIDRLLTALEAARTAPAAARGPVVVLRLDHALTTQVFAMVAELRNAGIRAEAFLGGGTNMGKQLKYADKRGAPAAVILGSDEAARGVVQVKDLVLGARLAAEIETNDEWKEQPAQVEIPRDDLVATIRRMTGD